MPLQVSRIIRDTPPIPQSRNGSIEDEKDSDGGSGYGYGVDDEGGDDVSGRDGVDNGKHSVCMLGNPS